MFRLVEAIHNELYDTYAFDFEGNYVELIRILRHMSLFSVCLYFLRCQRSCEKKAGYCKVCSRVRENTFVEYNAFLSLKVSHTDDYLNISSSEQIDLDVFLNEPVYFPYCHAESVGKCSDFEVFSFARDLFALLLCSCENVFKPHNRVFFRSNISG